MADTAPLPRFASIVVAAGKGLRAGGNVPKQFQDYRGKPLVRHSVEALHSAGCDLIVLVTPEGLHVEALEAAGLEDSIVAVDGGATRQLSVKAGLELLESFDFDHVLIHDAARPDLPRTVIERLLDALSRHPGAIPVLSVVDSLVVEEHGLMAEPADRAVTRRVQTPQAFRYRAILDAHRAWQGEPVAGDDAQVLRAVGGSVALVHGDERLKKVTFAEDLLVYTPKFRIGQGFDVHRLAAGEELWLCGVQIEHDKGLAGHSDADVALHALVDAMLGAIGAGDIGTHFPPSDPQWKGAPSPLFLEHACKLVKDSGFAIGNIDLTIICEEPKIGPYRDVMRARLAELLATPLERISIKATTTERLGFTGRGEGIATQAIVALESRD